MDWKNHILTNQVTPEELAVYRPLATEAYLVTWGNKGLYKRALKDLDGLSEPLVLEGKGGGCVAVRWPDVEVYLSPDVQKMTCTCPSKTVCKHLMMGVLAAAAASEAVLSDTVSDMPVVDEVTEEPWKELRETDLPALRKEAGKKCFEEALRWIQEGGVVELKEGDLLEAVLPAEQLSVYFPPQESMRRAVCKCGAAGLCRHKLVAVLTWLIRQGKALPVIASSSGGEEGGLKAETVALLEQAHSFVAQVLEKGLMNCGEEMAERTIRLSVHLEANGIGNVARLFHRLATDMSHLEQKHIGFHPLGTLETLGRLQNTLRLVLAHRNESARLKEWLEGVRSEYVVRPLGHFRALGAMPWQARSGYFGITAYLWYEEEQRVCSYSVSMTDYYEATQEWKDASHLRQLFTRAVHWSNRLSLEKISESFFVLRNFKINGQGRISSSLQTQCEVLGKMDEAALQDLQGCPVLGEEAVATEGVGYFSKKTADRLRLLPVRRMVNCRFNRLEQVLELALEESDTGRVHTLYLPYTPLNRTAIERLERHSRYSASVSGVWICLKTGRGWLPVVWCSGSDWINMYLK